MKSTFAAIFRTNSAVLRSVLLSAFAVFIFSFAAQSTEAATITVNSLSDALAGDGQCTLREAMTNANADNQSGSTDCVAGAGAERRPSFAFSVGKRDGHQSGKTTKRIAIAHRILEKIK